MQNVNNMQMYVLCIEQIKVSLFFFVYDCVWNKFSY